MIRATTTARTGTIAPLLAVVVISLFSFVALAIDLGMLNIARTHAQNAADAAALAGSRKLNNKPTAVDNDETLAVTVATNVVTNSAFFTDKITDDGTSSRKDHRERAGCTITTARRGRSSSSRPPVRLRPTRANRGRPCKSPLPSPRGPYFSRILGINSLDAQVTALAAHRPRDIAFALDFTGSMSNASTGNWGSSSLNSDSRYPQFGHCPAVYQLLHRPEQ